MRDELTQLAIVSLSPPIFVFHVCLLTNGPMQLMEQTPPLEGLYLLLIRALVYHRYIILTWQVLGPYIQVPHQRKFA